MRKLLISLVGVALIGAMVWGLAAAVGSTKSATVEAGEYDRMALFLQCEGRPVFQGWTWLGYDSDSKERILECRAEAGRDQTGRIDTYIGNVTDGTMYVELCFAAPGAKNVCCPFTIFTAAGQVSCGKPFGNQSVNFEWATLGP